MHALPARACIRVRSWVNARTLLPSKVWTAQSACVRGCGHHGPCGVCAAARAAAWTKCRMRA
eukprot:1638086-Pleurochrysis_carterae.AAC.1